MPDEPLRLVLFGPPGAGKSSLLGALGQAAEVQPHLLGGVLADPSPNLADLRRRVYEHGPDPTDEEVVAYSFTYEPSEKGEDEPRSAVVLDCDGRVADALVREPAPAGGTLGREMLHADALVVAVDASAPPEKIDAEFAEFDRFLRWMERYRGLRTDVGGLPVFLVLTKCDRLARPGQTAADWLEHIEDASATSAAVSMPFSRIAGRPPSAASTSTSGPPPSCVRRWLAAPPGRPTPTASPSCSGSASATRLCSADAANTPTTDSRR